MEPIKELKRGTFVVTRTSLYFSDDEKPCGEAYKADIVCVDERSTSNPNVAKRLIAGDNEWWFGFGENHREVNGTIIRDVVKSFWLVDVDDIMDFADEHGDVIVSRNYEGLPRIEIYDSYRE